MSLNTKVQCAHRMNFDQNHLTNFESYFLIQVHTKWIPTSGVCDLKMQFTSLIIVYWMHIHIMCIPYTDYTYIITFLKLES